MRLLLDTDAFCILAASGLLHDAVDLLGMDLAVCGRLPALPHMLRKGGRRGRCGWGAHRVAKRRSCNLKNPMWLGRSRCRHHGEVATLNTLPRPKALRHSVPALPVEEPSSPLLVYAAPLFEEEGHCGVPALVANIDHP